MGEIRIGMLSTVPPEHWHRLVDERGNRLLYVEAPKRVSLSSDDLCAECGDPFIMHDAAGCHQNTRLEFCNCKGFKAPKGK